MINVLSCFDGLSGGQLALEKSGIKVNQYFASEIDKFAIAVAKYNYPNTIHLGDVKKRLLCSPSTKPFPNPAKDKSVHGDPANIKSILGNAAASIILTSPKWIVLG